MGKHINNNLFDQYYTSRDLALECINYVIMNVEHEHRQFYLEPSVGIGSFLQSVVANKCLSVDIDPKIDGAIKADFLSMSPPHNWNRKISTVIGNPPFGHAGNLAVKFFNHSTLFSDTICFILPKSFKKMSIQNRIDLNYNLVFEKDLKNNGFVLIDNSPYKTCSCVFQIWKFRNTLPKREKAIFNNNPYLIFCQKRNAIAAIRRTGSKAGKLVPIDNSAESSTLFIKPRSGVTVEEMISAITRANLTETSGYTASVKAVSASEIHKKLLEL